MGASDLFAEKARTQWYFDVPKVTWSYLLEFDREAWAHVALEPSAAWLDEPDNEPVLYAGFYFATAQRRLPEELTRSDSGMSTAIAAINAKVGLQPNRLQGKCVKTCPLSRIAARGGTLSCQAEYAAGWAVEVLQQIARIVP